MTEKLGKKLYLALFFLVIILSFTARLYRFDNPIADWHSWRQVDTSSVSRVFYEEGFNLLYPRYHDLSNVPSGIDNPIGYRFVEFPIYNFFQAGFLRVFGHFTLEEWGRLVSILSSIASIVVVYLLVLKYHNRTAAIISAFFMGFIPFNIYYGRVILPDPSMVTAILGATYFFDKWLELRKKNKSISDIRYPVANLKSYILNYKPGIYYLLSVVLTSVAFLIKPYALFFTLPMAYLAFKNLGIGSFKKPELYVFLILSILPLIAWRVWMLNFPEGIPASQWLFNLDEIRFKGAFFYWIFADRIGRLILGYFGLVIFAFGFLSKSNDKYFFYTFLLSAFLYVFVLAGGNVRHDYYQILIIPALAIFMGLGGDFLINQTKALGRRIPGIFIFGICTIFSLMFGWYHVRDYFNINNPNLLVAGNRTDEILPKDAKVIANYGGDTTFLYATKRKGWASFQASLSEMKKLGADYLIFVNPTPDDFDYAKDYELILSESEVAIFDLNIQK